MSPPTTAILLFVSICLLASATVVLIMAIRQLKSASAANTTEVPPQKPKKPGLEQSGELNDPELVQKRDIGRFLFRLRVASMDKSRRRPRRLDSDIENN